MPHMTYRELYCPAHFGNSYEVMASYEMKDLLREAQHWGFNAYADWLDAADLKDPHNNPKGEHLMPQVLWDRKLESFRISSDLGLSVSLVVTPNHVYLDQLAADLLADTSDKRFFGQLVCPSKPKAWQIIIENHRRLFKDLKDRGVRLESVSGCPFDYGGCACSSCSPWIVTFGKLMVAIHDAAKEFFPDVKARLIGWWWTKDEHHRFKEWADREHPGRFVSMAAHIPYGHTRPNPDVELPDGCELHAFVHIGYADKAEPRDVYGPWGPVVAPNRLPTTVYELEGIGCTGFMAYSEGVFDDINKALLAALSSGKAKDSQSVLEEYAERYIGSDHQGWARWITQWGEPFKVDTSVARKEFNRLKERSKVGWRTAQLESKLRIFEAHAEVMRLKGWDAGRLAAADRFFLERDKLFRSVWGLGLVRHALNQFYHRPSWYAEWAEFVTRDTGGEQLRDER